MNVVNFFINHKKPAISASVDKVDSRLWEYPFLYIYRSSHNYYRKDENDCKSCRLVGYEFFQTEEDRDIALALGHGMSKYERGIMYGYPPTAIEFFLLQQKMATTKAYNSLDRIIIDYYGLSFVCSKMNFGQVCQELYEMYRLSPSKIKVRDFTITDDGLFRMSRMS